MILSDSEIFGSIAKDLAIEELQRLTGPKTDFEQREIEKITPSLNKTSQGNKLLVQIGKIAAQRNIALAKHIDDFIASAPASRMNARQLRSAVRGKQNQFLSANPLLTPELKKQIEQTKKAPQIKAGEFDFYLCDKHPFRLR